MSAHRHSSHSKEPAARHVHGHRDSNDDPEPPPPPPPPVEDDEPPPPPPPPAADDEPPPTPHPGSSKHGRGGGPHHNHHHDTHGGSGGNGAAALSTSGSLGGAAAATAQPPHAHAHAAQSPPPPLVLPAPPPLVLPPALCAPSPRIRTTPPQTPPTSPPVTLTPPPPLALPAMPVPPLASAPTGTTASSTAASSSSPAAAAATTTGSTHLLFPHRNPTRTVPALRADLTPPPPLPRMEVTPPPRDLSLPPLPRRSADSFVAATPRSAASGSASGVIHLNTAERTHNTGSEVVDADSSSAARAPRVTLSGALAALGTSDDAMDRLWSCGDHPPVEGEFRQSGTKKWSKATCFIYGGILRVFPSLTEPEIVSVSLTIYLIGEMDKKCPKTSPFGVKLHNPQDKKQKSLYIAFSSAEILASFTSAINNALELANPVVFGLPLHFGCLKSGQLYPAPVLQCIEYLEANNGVSQSGIFRLSAAGVSLQTLKDQFNKGTAPEFNDPYAVAAVLKLYLRELPDPLLTFALYDSFMEAAKSGSAVTDNLKALILKLPLLNQASLRYLMKYISKVAENHATNLMTARNLAVVFGPTILRPREETLELAAVSDTTNYVCESMITGFSAIFGEPICSSLFEKAKAKREENLANLLAAVTSCASIPPSSSTPPLINPADILGIGDSNISAIMVAKFKDPKKEKKNKEEKLPPEGTPEDEKPKKDKKPKADKVTEKSAPATPSLPGALAHTYSQSEANLSQPPPLRVLPPSFTPSSVKLRPTNFAPPTGSTPATPSTPTTAEPTETKRRAATMISASTPPVNPMTELQRKLARRSVATMQPLSASEEVSATPRSTITHTPIRQSAPLSGDRTIATPRPVPQPPKDS
ncbi:Rho GTPase-activating protein [Pelomyxa schiedti]|nr:Rho GTPase-activating protein [Pelomyxa schiedti]